jgi:hypothetical protein
MKAGEDDINMAALVGFSQMKLHEGFPLKLFNKSSLRILSI